MSATVTSSIPKPKKRKARPDDDAPPKVANSTVPVGKKRKQNTKKGKRVAQDDDSLLDLDAGLNLAIANMDSQLLSDYLAQQTTRFGTDLSSVELADLHVPAGAIKDTSSFGDDKPRNLENLPSFLETFADGGADEMGKAAKEKGAPHTIIVAGAGLRAADLCRAVRKYQKKGNTVAKLFAKHIKLEEAVSFLKNNSTGVAVGTPVRLMDLLDNGALSTKSLRRIVVDASHIDQKKRGVMDMRETAIPLARWLARPEFKERYVHDDNRLDLIFY
ncbi:csm1-like protein [Pyricularia grisea]|nr:csm1-like protein [Pyricularia grisea]